MIVKFFKFGKGGSKPCIDYLLGKDRDREHARVLSGDVDLTADLIDSSRFTKKYTAGCLSFAEADIPEDAKRKIMADFEKTLFPGMSPDQYNITWIEHRDKGRLELNFVIPNVELSTGKRLQPFYAPADLGRVDCFKKITNHDYNLHDPDDPENRQLARVDLDDQGEIQPKKGEISKSKTSKEIAEDIDIKVMQAYLNGDIKDRDDTILFLVDELKLNVTRITNKGISILPEGRSRPIRLKGEIYEQGFTTDDRPDSPEEERRADSYRSRISGAIGGIRAEYESRCSGKAEEIARRYRPSGHVDSPESSFNAKTTHRASDGVQQLYTSAINANKQNTWNIDSRFSGFSFDSIYLDWQASKRNRNKRESVEATATSILEPSQSTKIEVENAARRKIIELGRETVTLYQAMSPHDDIAKSNDRELAAQNEHTRRDLRGNSEATARAISDANASYERFRRNISFGNTDAAALRKVFESEELKQQPKPEPVVIQTHAKTPEPQKQAEKTQIYDGPDGP